MGAELTPKMAEHRRLNLEVAVARAQALEYMALCSPASTRPRHQETLTGNGGVGGRLNPRWVEWVMGFPEGWTDCEPLETQ